MSAARLNAILDHWIRSDFAWNARTPTRLDPRHLDLLLAVLESPRIPRSGRAMWNLAMWVDEHWHLLPRTTQQLALSRICQIMLHGCHNRSCGLWKLGDTLGDHIGTPSAQRVLEQVAVEAEHPEARDSALHGLIHYAAAHPRARHALLARLRPVASQHHGEAKLAFEWAISRIERRSSCG